MPTTITTEAARVAMAHREYDQAVAEIEAQMDARAAVLMQDPRATDRAAFQQLCAADPEFRELVLAQAAVSAWRDAVIEDRCIATIEDDGQVRWTLSQYANPTKH
jgi:hypothetical protein